MRIKYTLTRQSLQRCFWYVLVSFFITSCSFFSIGKRGVFYSEMSKKPEISIYDFGFEVLTENSSQNSALSLYKIKIQVDTIHREIRLAGYQAANKKYRDSFRIETKNLSKNDLDRYEFYWTDPDRKDNKLTIRK